MNKTTTTKIYGLIGKNIAYSFSKNYFSNKQHSLNENFIYQNFDCDTLSDFLNVIKNNTIAGLNVTIPYKESIIPFLDDLSDIASKIGAVNTIKIHKNKLIGYNTDYYGFKKALSPLLKKHHTKALILGTGGASKAIAFALNELSIAYTFVSRNVKTKKNTISYNDINEAIFSTSTIIINTTPVGTFPDINNCLPLPCEYFSKKHIAFDLIYNPTETLFLRQAKKNGATIKNGYDMLVFQAEKAWEIWHL